MPSSFPSRDISNQYESQSYQNLVQRYVPGLGDANEYLLDAIGNVILSFPTSSVGQGIITSDQIVSSASYSLFSEFSDTSSYALISVFSNYSSTASLSYVIITVSSSWASASLSASYSKTASYALNGGGGTQVSCSWASQSLSASYVPNLYPQVPITQSLYSTQSISASYSLTASYALNSTSGTQISCSWASSSLSASYVPDLYPKAIQVSCSWASASLSASYAPQMIQTVVASASWVSASVYITNSDTASYVANLYPQTPTTQSIYSTQSLYSTSSLTAVSSSWASSSISASYVPNIYPQTPTTQSIYATSSLTSVSASWASSSLSCSVAISASYSPQILQTTVASASWVSSSSYIVNSDTASYVATASYYPSFPTSVLSSSWASASISASYVPNLYPQLPATQSIYSTQSLYATSSISASYSLTSSYSLNGGTNGTQASCSWASSSVSSSYASHTAMSGSIILNINSTIAITLGDKGNTILGNSIVLSSWTLICNSSGSIAVEVQKSDYNSYPSFMSLTGGNFVNVSAQIKNQSLISGWASSSLNAGDIIKFIVTSSNSTVTGINLILQGIKYV